MFHESPVATADMAVLPGVLGCSFDRLWLEFTLAQDFEGCKDTMIRDSDATMIMQS
jgi:hypothetical protein